MGANTTSREDQKDNTAAAECKSSLIMHANNYCEFTREMEELEREKEKKKELNATMMMVEIEIVSRRSEAAAAKVAAALLNKQIE